MKKIFKLETGADMYFVDLAITDYINSIRTDYDDNPANRLIEACLLKNKRRLEHCMVNQWDMKIGEELQLIERTKGKEPEVQE